jgi:hypothetical protein
MKTLVLAALAGTMLAATSAIPRQQDLVKAELVSTSLGRKADMTVGQGAVAPHSQAAPRTSDYPCMDYNPVKRTCGLHRNQEPSWLSNDTPMDG